MPKRVSSSFGLTKSQAELDFVDVFAARDVLLFVDPFAVSQRVNPWSQNCHRVLVDFFQHVVEAIREDNEPRATALLSHFGEPNETRLGLSTGRPRGRGVGPDLSGLLLEALSKSSAVRTGFIRSIEECELMVEGIGRDRMSDLVTNILRRELAEYTRQQCVLLGVPLRTAAVGPYYDRNSGEWISDYFDLPTAGKAPVLLVPRSIVRHDPAYDHRDYYDRFVVDYLQAEHLNANSSLVYTLRSGERRVYKKDVKAQFRCTKENLFEFSRRHPNVLNRYRKKLEALEARGPAADVSPAEERIIAKSLATALRATQPGSPQASEYHNLMIGIVEFLFYPDLVHPLKELEIHEGRKRIDLLMENGATQGIFRRLHEVRGLPCAFVPFECKNYTTEVANPELDQLSGRFSTNRGRLGFLCCRHFEDRGLFVRRCQDTHRDGRGLVVPLDDAALFQLLDHVEQGRREGVEHRVGKLVNEVWLDS